MQDLVPCQPHRLQLHENGHRLPQVRRQSGIPHVKDRLVGTSASRIAKQALCRLVPGGTFPLLVEREENVGTLFSQHPFQSASAEVGQTVFVLLHLGVYQAGHTVAGSTINFNGGAQTVPGFTYYNLTTSGSGVKTLGGDALVAGTLSLTAGSFADGGYTLTANGNVTNNVAHSGAGRLYLNGAVSTHLLGGTGSYGNVEINDEYGASLASNLRIAGTLTLTAIQIPPNKNPVP